MLTPGLPAAGIIPVMALPAHRSHELALPGQPQPRQPPSPSPDRLRDFDHRRWPASWPPSLPPTRSRLVLTTSDTIRRRSADLTALCARARDPAIDPATVGRAPAGQPRRRVLPALRRHDRAAQADRAHPRRLRLQRRAPAPQSRPRPRHRLPGHAARQRTTSRWPARASSGTLLAGGESSCCRRRSRSGPSPRSPPRGSRVTAVVPAVAQRWLEHAGANTAPATLQQRYSRAAGRRRPAAPTSSPARSSRCWAPGSSRSSAWPRACSTTPASTTPTRSSAPPRAARSPGRRDPSRRRAGQRRSRRRAGLAAHPRPLHPARLLPGGRAERPRLHRRRLVPQRRHLRRPLTGNLIVEGRDKDMINRGGEKISAEEVENFVYQLPRRRAGRRGRHARPRAWRARVPLRRAPDRAPAVTLEEIARRWRPPASPGSSCPSAWSWSTRAARHQGRQDRQEGAARGHRRSAPATQRSYRRGDSDDDPRITTPEQELASSTTTSKPSTSHRVDSART